ncbi:MAG: hypothetical protein R3C45_02940 [Phycisphaerales bacterium]
MKAMVTEFWLYAWCLLLFVLVPIATSLLYRRAQQSVKRRLKDRPIMSFDDWYNTHFDEDGPNRELTEAFLKVLSNEFALHPTQILPSDRFDVELRPDSWWSARGHELEMFEMWLEEATQGYGQPTDEACSSVEGLIVWVDRIRRNLPVQVNDNDETFTLPRSLSCP